MPEPSVEVLGVYRLRATDELIRDRIESSFPREWWDTREKRTAAEQECREFLEAVVLVEALIHNRDERFKCDFTQRVGGASWDDWQVAYAEAYLTPDGEALVAERWSLDVPPATSALRSICIIGIAKNCWRRATAMFLVPRSNRCRSASNAWYRTKT